MDQLGAGMESSAGGKAGTNERVEYEIRIDSLTRNLLDCYEELDLIYRLSRRGLSALDAQDNVDFILSEAMEIFEADAGWLTAVGSDPAFRPVSYGISCDDAAASRIVAAPEAMRRHVSTTIEPA